MKQTSIYWVVGDHTDVGKTAVVTALIRLLNHQGIPAVGFKPYAAIKLQDSFDFIAKEYQHFDSKLFGKDALSIAESSPLTNELHLELIAPTQFLCHPHWGRAVLVRHGSNILRNVEFFRPKNTDQFLNRDDVQRLLSKTPIPFATARIMDELNISNVQTLPKGKQEIAFDELKKLGADSVVIEGFGMFLPVWDGCPITNHIVSIVNGWVAFYPNIDLCITPNQQRNLTLEDIFPMLSQYPIKNNSIPLYLAESEFRNDCLEEMLKRLFSMTEFTATQD